MDVLKGIVRKGQKRGKKLGFPTANIPLQTRFPEGIYLSYIALDKHRFPSLTFIGSAKTFGETSYQAEVYILDFDRDIYGKEVSVELIKKIRDNKKFETVESLVKQMKDDRIQAEKFFKGTKSTKSIKGRTRS